MAFEGRGNSKGAEFVDSKGRPQTAGRVAMARRIREDRDPKLRDESGFEDATGPDRRRKMDTSLAIMGAMNAEATRKTLAADQSFAKVEQLRGGHALLVAMGIMNGATIKGMAERLHGPTLNQVKAKDIGLLRVALRQGNHKAPIELVKALSEHASDVPQKLLSNDAFVELVFSRNKGAELLAHIKASAWTPGLEMVLKETKIAEFVQQQSLLPR